MEIVNKKKEKKIKTEEQLLKSANSFLKKGEHKKVIEVIDQLISEYVTTRDNKNDIKVTVQDAIIYYNRSLAKYNINDLEGAVEDLNASLSIYELNQAYFQLFIIYNQQNKTQEAIEFLIKSYKLGNLDAVSILSENTNYFN